MNVIKTKAFTVRPRGGATTAHIFDDEGNLLGYGQAICAPSDNYCRKVGRKIAETRALHDARKRLAATNGQPVNI